MLSARYPAPWRLRGSAYILLYRFPRDFVLDAGFVPAALRDRYLGGLGVVMLVDYESSEGGPYLELLLLPGRFRLAGKRRYSITKIYVSTAASVDNGRANWAIPKELAQFSFAPEVARRQRVSVRLGGEPILEAELQRGRLPLPVSTALLPFPLAQPDGERTLVTSFSGRGVGYRARLESLRVNSRLFPDISAVRPIFALALRPFRVVFPEAVVASE
jgi:hypothetical protein